MHVPIMGTTNSSHDYITAELMIFSFCNLTDILDPPVATLSLEKFYTPTENQYTMHTSIANPSILPTKVSVSFFLILILIILLKRSLHINNQNHRHTNS